MSHNVSRLARPSSNLMSYYRLSGEYCSLSDSQVMRVRKYLRWIVAGENGMIKPNQTFSSNLPLFGNGNIRQVAEDLDFDCDGKRDIRISEPPTSQTFGGGIYSLAEQ